LSTIIGPSCPGPILGATKIYPGAVPCACVVTSIVGGLSSGRERKPGTCLGGGEWRVCWECRLGWASRSAGLHPSVFNSATHALPAPIALRNSPRVCPVLKFFFYPSSSISASPIYLSRFLDPKEYRIPSEKGSKGPSLCGARL